MTNPFVVGGEFVVCLVIFLFGCALAGLIYVREKRVRFSLLNDLFEVSDYGKVLFSSKGTLIKINSYAVQMLSSVIDGSVHSMTKGQFVDGLYDNAADFDDSIRNALLGDTVQKGTENFKEVILCGKGEPYLVNVRTVNKDYVLFTLTNIDMQQKREANLIQLDLINRHLFHAMQAVTSGIIISDPKQEKNPVLFANEAFHDFVGCSEQELFSEHWQVLSTLFSDEHEKQVFVEALSSCKDVDVSLSNVIGDITHTYNLKLAPVFDQEQMLDLYVGILTDVTLLKQRESEFFHSQKLDSLGQLAAGVAHDFNNLLSIIGGYSMMISKQVHDDEMLLGFTEKISAASERGAGLTRKMLTFSKHKVVSQDVLDLRDIVQEQKELLVPLLTGAVELELSIGAEAYNARGNADSFSQIIMNLVINARDAMPDGGVLLLGLEVMSAQDVPERIHKGIDAEDYIRLFVKDTGTGMDANTLSKVFDPFFSTKEKGKGTGLGLSVVYGLVNEMNGALDVQSVLGQGSTFSVYVPRSSEPKTKEVLGDLKDVASIKLNGFKALIVEDEPDLLEIVTRMLETAGAEVSVASNGNEALAICDKCQGDFDIVLTDVVMPELNGVKLAELIQSLFPEVKIIFMSGYPAHGDMAPVDIPEALPFIAKPVDYEALIRIVYCVLHNEDSGSDQVSHWQSAKTMSDTNAKGE